jgi:serine protease inhibitor
MKRNISVLLAIMLFVCGCSSSEIKKDPTPLVILPKTMQIIEADNIFGLKVFRYLNENTDPEVNLFISPTSISLALAMVYNGAAGETKTAMEEAMQVAGLTTDEINETYQSLMNGLVTLDPEVTLTIANSIWHHNTFEVSQPFIDVNTNFYNAMVTPLDFGNPSSVEIINTWVSDQTNHKITEILQSIPDYAVMYLINAIYFKGTWKYQFNEDYTYDRNFYPEAGNTGMKPFMHQTADAMVKSNNLFKGLILPYGNDLFNMVILVPEDGKVVADICADLTVENWNTWMEEFSLSENLKIHLPKFKFEYEETLKKVLTELGMGIAFSDNADFTGINPAGNLLITEVKHKSFVEVNEEGTEAAAVTSVEVGVTSVGPPVNEFVADRSFIFAITEKSTNAIIFIGKLNMP